ncbi:MAG: polysaccharide deacetylase family protein [Hyphomonas sp.]
MMGIRTAIAALGLVMLAACSHDRGPPGPCGPSALGTSRIQTVGLDAGPVPDLLARGEVVITFDDGPHPSRTRRVLDLLDRECVQATFFLLGTQAAANPGMVREIAARGHSLGAHSWNHARLTESSVEAAVADIDQGAAAIEAATGRPVMMFRFPYIDTSPALSEAVREAGYLDVTVTVDGRDWLNISPGASVQEILNRLEANGRKGIVLLHDPFRSSDQRTRLLIDALKAADYRVVALQPAG